MKRIAPYALLVTGFVVLVISQRYFSTFTYSIRTETIQVTSAAQIVRLGENYVKPLLYTHIAGLSELPVREGKLTFIAAVLPAVLVAKHEIDMLRIRLAMLEHENAWSKHDSSLFQSAKKRYRAKNLQDLLHRMGTLPNSIVLAQAALESGWGQSRLFLEGNNLFGVWSFDSKEPRIPAGKSRNKRTIYLRAYDNMSESIVNYFEILASSHAYQELREARHTVTDPFELVPFLNNFSERRYAYTRQLASVIEQNKLTTYDDYFIDPEYLIERVQP